MRLQHIEPLPGGAHIGFAVTDVLIKQLINRPIKGQTVVANIHMAIVVDPVRQDFLGIHSDRRGIWPVVATYRGCCHRGTLLR